MKNFLIRLVLVGALASAGRAAPYTQNLGLGLTYYRIHQLPGDLPAADGARRSPCVLDLRYVAGTAEDGDALAAWLKSHATPRAPVFVLANASTSAALISVIAPRGAGTSLIVFGAANADFTPDIALKVSAEAERRAYDAVEHGSSAGSLIAESSDKPRNDEAKLARERRSLVDYVAAPDDPAASTSTTANETVKAKPPQPVIDVVLQRAVQTHRTLVALKKL